MSSTETPLFDVFSEIEDSIVLHIDTDGSGRVFTGHISRLGWQVKLRQEYEFSDLRELEDYLVNRM
jgi:hypothetical protein